MTCNYHGQPTVQMLKAIIYYMWEYQNIYIYMYDSEIIFNLHRPSVVFNIRNANYQINVKSLFFSLECEKHILNYFNQISVSFLNNSNITNISRCIQTLNLVVNIFKLISVLLYANIMYIKGEQSCRGAYIRFFYFILLEFNESFTAAHLHR